MAYQATGVTSAIEVLRKRIRHIRERKEIIGEENTKATLIDPLLEALGWDLREIDEVRREYRRKPQDNPVDYALFLNRTECLFIEAKSLEKDLSDHKWITQNLSYATGAGVQWCVLTNGDEYRIYNAHAPVAVEEKLFRSVRISETDPEYLVGTLVLLSKEKMRGSLLEEMWKAHFVDRKVSQAVEGLLAEEDPGLVRLIQKRAGGLSAVDIRASLKRAKIRIDFPVPIPPGSPEGPPVLPEAPAKATLEELIATGLIRPPLELERDYNGVHLVAVIQQNGKVEFAGQTYDSVSMAATVARKSVIHRDVSTNGWMFWRYRDANGELHEMDHLRKQYLAARK